MAALAAKAVKDQRRKAAQLKLADNMTDQKQNRKQSLTSVTTMGSFDPEVWHHIADYLYSMIAAACYSQKKTKNLIIVQEIANKLRMFCRAGSPKEIVKGSSNTFLPSKLKYLYSIVLKLMAKLVVMLQEILSTYISK